MVLDGEQHKSLRVLPQYRLGCVVVYLRYLLRWRRLLCLLYQCLVEYGDALDGDRDLVRLVARVNVLLVCLRVETDLLGRGLHLEAFELRGGLSWSVSG